MLKLRAVITLVSVFVFFSCQFFSKLENRINHDYTEKVNVFLGTSGDHGQLSPAASYPFSMLSIGPQTKHHTHAGFEYYAREFDGFTHTRIEGVGCTGSGGNILIKPIINQDIETKLIKVKQTASPGNFSVSFDNGISAEMGVDKNFGIHNYHFPNTKSSLFVDLSYAFSNRFITEEHIINDTIVNGFVDTQTTCGFGVYRIYYALKFRNSSSIKHFDNHQLIVTRKDTLKPMEVHVSLSSVNSKYALNNLKKNATIHQVKEKSNHKWNELLGKIRVEGEEVRENLFYSLLYRGLHSPYMITENDGTYKTIDGTIKKTNHPIYNGWAIWDNYREQLPMLSLFYPKKFSSISKSIANLYAHGKKDWATLHEPSPTVRTEHAIVVLLDAYRKGYDIDFKSIKDSLINEIENLSYNSPDKALESSYDNWALAEILKIIGDISLFEKYKSKALNYKDYWKKDFEDLFREDVDVMQARGLYQGTIWQYRWFVPFDLEGLQDLIGETEFTKQLDQFFDENNYNHANQPDLQVPGIYNSTNQPWKSQKLFRNIMLDTVVQYYFNNNSKGIDPFIGKIYNNSPKAFLRTMDDDAGTMSSWFVMRSLGLSPANVGNPIYYLTAPIFKSVKINLENNKSFAIEVKNYSKDNFYIKSAYLNGEKIERNWLSHKEIINGGTLLIEVDSIPNKSWGVTNRWISKFK